MRLHEREDDLAPLDARLELRERHALAHQQRAIDVGVRGALAEEDLQHLVGLRPQQRRVRGVLEGDRLGERGEARRGQGDARGRRHPQRREPARESCGAQKRRDDLVAHLERRRGSGRRREDHGERITITRGQPAASAIRDGLGVGRQPRPGRARRRRQHARRRGVAGSDEPRRSDDHRRAAARSREQDHAEQREGGANLEASSHGRVPRGPVVNRAGRHDRTAGQT